MDTEKILNFLHILDLIREYPKLRPIHDLVMMDLEEMVADAEKELADKKKKAEEKKAKEEAEKKAAAEKEAKASTPPPKTEEDHPTPSYRRT